MVFFANGVTEKPMLPHRVQQTVKEVENELGEAMIIELAGHASVADTMSKLHSACQYNP